MVATRSLFFPYFGLEHIENGYAYRHNSFPFAHYRKG